MHLILETLLNLQLQASAGVLATIGPRSRPLHQDFYDWVTKTFILINISNFEMKNSVIDVKLVILMLNISMT